jgi:hypothetical protein
MPRRSQTEKDTTMQITFRKSLLAALLSGTVAAVTPVLAGTLVVAQTGTTGGSSAAPNEGVPQLSQPQNPAGPNAAGGANQSAPNGANANGAYGTNPNSATGTYGGYSASPGTSGTYGGYSTSPSTNTSPSTTAPSSTSPSTTSPYGNSSPYGSQTEGYPSSQPNMTTQPHG